MMELTIQQNKVFEQIKAIDGINKVIMINPIKDGE